MSDEAAVWLEQIEAGWTWEPHEREVLRLAAQAYDRFLQACRELDEHGVTFLDRFGQPRLHPAALVERDARSAVLSALRRLRFSEETQLRPGELLALPVRRGRRSA